MDAVEPFEKDMYIVVLFGGFVWSASYTGHEVHGSLRAAWRYGTVLVSRTLAMRRVETCVTSYGSLWLH